MDQQTRELDRELWNPAIHWLLNVAPAELGAKGTLGSTISALEHGGDATGVPNTELTNYDVGWCVGDSPSERWRKTAPIWFSLGHETQGVHLAHYTPRNDLPEAQRVAVDGALGKLANAALWVHEGEKLSKLIEACVDKGLEGRGKIIRNGIKRTDEAVRVAHRIWMAVVHVGPSTPIDARTVITGPTKASGELWTAEYARRQHERDVRAPEFSAAMVVAGLCRAIGRKTRRKSVGAQTPPGAPEDRDAA